MSGSSRSRRDVCSAKDAGFIEFSGLPGSIKTGCQATPAYKSCYCKSHKHFARDSQQLTGKEDEDCRELDAPIGPVLRSAQKYQEPGERIVELILEKKATRRQTYYKVRYYST